MRIEFRDRGPEVDRTGGTIFPLREFLSTTGGIAPPSRAIRFRKPAAADLALFQMNVRGRGHFLIKRDFALKEISKLCR